MDGCGRGRDGRGWGWGDKEEGRRRKEEEKRDVHQTRGGILCAVFCWQHDLKCLGGKKRKKTSKRIRDSNTALISIQNGDGLNQTVRRPEGEGTYTQNKRVL